MLGPSPRVLTVTQLARRVREVLDGAFRGPMWVAGELSNVRRPASGHVYFTLKDDQSQLGAVMFRSAAQVLVFNPADGMQVIVLARPGVFPDRGTLQLYVERMEPRGLGALQLALEQLKARLAAEGLFEDGRKRALPRFPRAVGIVTALEGAAIHDMRTVLRRRWPAARVLIRPVRVQGRAAAPEIAAAINDVGRAGGVDVLVVGRGGGSLEDLWAFNEEAVVRAIAAAPVPVVSAVGHEVDYTLADFVADARAPTPTAAAALVVPDRREVLAGLGRAADELGAALARRVRGTRERLGRLERGLGDPRRRVRDLAQRLDELAAAARRGLARRTAWDRRELGNLSVRLERGGPSAQLARSRERLGATEERLGFALATRLRHARATLAKSASKLGVLSPLACLERGYAIVRRGDAAGPVVTDATALTAGDPVALRFARGRAWGRIERTEP